MINLKIGKKSLVGLALLMVAYAFGAPILENYLYIGKGDASNKRIIFNRGGSNAEIRWNESTSALEFSDDGSSFVAVARSGTAGQIFAFAGSTCPTGSVAADGTAYSRTVTYDTLFAAIDDDWGVGDGSTTFNVPDLRNRFLRGTGTNGDGNGGTAVSLAAFQADATAKNGLTATGTQSDHTHFLAVLEAVSPASGDLTSGTYMASNLAVGGANDYLLQRPTGGSPNAGLTSGASSGTVTVTVGAGDAETRPHSYGVLYCIWY
jgi:microcystin-dependent protein